MPDNKIAALFRDLWVAHQQYGERFGMLGKQVSSQWVIETGDGRVWVTLDDGTAIRVINNAVARLPGLKVIVRPNRDGDMEIAGVQSAITQQSTGQSNVPAIQTPPHRHFLGSGNEDPVESRRFMPGLVHAFSGLTVYIEPFPFRYNGTDYRWPGGTYDLTPDLPVTSGYWAWIKVGIDPETNTAVADTSAEVALRALLSLSLLDAIDFATAGYIPCGGVIVREGQTTGPLEADFAETRQFLNVDPNLLALPDASYRTLQDMQNVVHSAGWVDGGVVSDNGDGTVDVTAGEGLLRATDDPLATLWFIHWDASLNVALTDNSANYVYVDWNAGNPTVAANAVTPSNFRSRIYLATIYRIGTELHIFAPARFTVGDHAGLMMRNMSETMPFARVNGGVLTGVNRDILISAGAWWNGLTRFTTAAFDSSGADTFNSYYRDGGGGWTEVTAQSQINNTQYDDGSGTLATLTANRYGVHWVYIASDDDVHTVFGQGDYTLAQAQEAQPPDTIPPELVVDSRLAGKVIIQKSAASFFSVESAFKVPFAAGSGGLAGVSAVAPIISSGGGSPVISMDAQPLLRSFMGI